MARLKNILAIMLLLAGGMGTAVAGETYPPLADSRDTALQQRLAQSVDSLGLGKAVQRGQLSVALVDITDPAAPRYAALNDTEMMYAASLPKIAILLGAFKRIEEGDMALDARTRNQLVQMIRHSSNSAATAMLHRVGPEYLADLLRSPEYRLYDAELNGGLWCGKDYGKGGVWKRDPLHHLSHGATAFQVARYYYLLETGQLVSPELTREMKAVLGKPAIKHKFVKGLMEMGVEPFLVASSVEGLMAQRPGSEIYRKSGTWRDYHADSAIVERDGRRYIAVGLAHSGQGSKWLSNLIVAMDDLVFQSAATQVAALD